MKKIMAIALPLMLCACGEQPVVSVPHYQIVQIPEDMDKCPSPPKLPSSKRLTDIQVARTVIKLYQNNVKCRDTVDAMRKYLEDAQADIKQPE